MVWQLIQVDHLKKIPLILVGRMWPGLIEWAQTSMLSVDQPLANADDMAIPQCVPNADEAIALVRRYNNEWVASQPG